MFGVYFGFVVSKTKTKSKKDPIEEVTLLNQMAYSMSLCNEFQLLQSVDPGTAGSVDHSTDTYLLKKRQSKTF